MASRLTESLMINFDAFSDGNIKAPRLRRGLLAASVVALFSVIWRGRTGQVSRLSRSLSSRCNVSLLFFPVNSGKMTLIVLADTTHATAGLHIPAIVSSASISSFDLKYWFMMILPKATDKLVRFCLLNVVLIIN